MNDLAARHLRELDLEPTATVSDIKRAFRQLALVWHPDRFSGNEQLRAAAERKMARINAARAWLLDNLSEWGPQAQEPRPSHTSGPHAGAGKPHAAQPKTGPRYPGSHHPPTQPSSTTSKHPSKRGPSLGGILFIVALISVPTIRALSGSGSNSGTTYQPAPRSSTTPSAVPRARFPTNTVPTMPTFPSTSGVQPTVGQSASEVTPASSSTLATEPAPFGSSSTAQTHSVVVVPGDSLWQIAQANGVAVDDIIRANGLTSTVIVPGQVLNVPSREAQASVPLQPSSGDSAVRQPDASSPNSLQPMATESSPPVATEALPSVPSQPAEPQASSTPPSVTVAPLGEPTESPPAGLPIAGTASDSASPPVGARAAQTAPSSLLDSRTSEAVPLGDAASSSGVPAAGTAASAAGAESTITPESPSAIAAALSPDLSSFTAEERRIIESQCSSARSLRGLAAYNQCLISQLTDLQ
ncbi:MAG: LysM peptidoglycan-binding domain-containing protein [Trueperaceae bacterium]|nr:LysM peptidoglycan-binding domain-containing protein [Trueperaceae bacterium]